MDRPTESAPTRLDQRIESLDRPRACRYAARLLGKASLAEDMVQEAVMRVLRVGGDRAVLFDAYFYRTLTNVCWNELKRRRPGASSDAGVPAEESRGEPSGDAALTVERRELSQRVAEALDRLPPSQRIAIVLKEWEGLAYARIAEVMEVSETNAATLVWRGLKSLRASFREERER